MEWQADATSLTGKTKKIVHSQWNQKGEKLVFSYVQKEDATHISRNMIGTQKSLNLQYDIL